MGAHKFPYQWNLSDGYPAKGIEYHGSKVFSCFSCGGGSTMGYKLSGYDVIGCNEIDPKMMAAYIANHHPKYPFLEDIRTFKTRKDLPDELYHLDILDGSPPCSSFSMAGNREKDWGSEKKFREGQADQVLDTLFFDFIDLAKRLQPKVVIAENVKGLMMGEAWSYMREIYKQFDEAGYYCQHFLLDASKMGVPQRRERVFFICLRKDLAEPFIQQVDMFNWLPKIEMEFDEVEIPFKDIDSGIDAGHKNGTLDKFWDQLQPGQSASSITGGSHFAYVKVKPDLSLPTLTNGGKQVTVTLFHDKYKRYLDLTEVTRGQTFPNDFFTKNINHLSHIITMSVPPVMMAQVASNVHDQWLSKII